MIELTEVYIHYNPYRLTTFMTINGNPLSEDSSLAQAISGKRLQSWIGSLPDMLKNERGSREFQIIFHGNALDYDDVKDSFEQARKKGVISDYHTMCEESIDDSNVYESILSTYNDLMSDPYFSDSLSKSDREGLEGAIKRVQNDIFPIHVIATMSSGKSTLINALLRKKLMPSKNEACTAIITEILDNDGDDFSAIVYDRSDNKIKTIAQLTYEIMNELNSNEDISRVFVEGNIPFLTATETRLRLVDTPGPREKYCDYKINGSDKTCRSLAAQEKYNRKCKSDPVIEKKRKIQKRFSKNAASTEDVIDKDLFNAVKKSYYHYIDMIIGDYNSGKLTQEDTLNRFEKSYKEVLKLINTKAKFKPSREERKRASKEEKMELENDVRLIMEKYIDIKTTK